MPINEPRSSTKRSISLRSQLPVSPISQLLTQQTCYNITTNYRISQAKQTVIVNTTITIIIISSSSSRRLSRAILAPISCRIWQVIIVRWCHRWTIRILAAPGDMSTTTAPRHAPTISIIGPRRSHHPSIDSIIITRARDKRNQPRPHLRRRLLCAESNRSSVGHAPLPQRANSVVIAHIIPMMTWIHRLRWQTRSAKWSLVLSICALAPVPRCAIYRRRRKICMPKIIPTIR